MNRVRVWSPTILLLLTSCSNNDIKVCTPRSTRACTCVMGQGIETCLDNGKTWGPCTGCLTARDVGVDRSQPDQSPDRSTADTRPPCPAVVIGKPCTEAGNECGNAATCVITHAKGGVCACDCVPDDPQTPLANEDSCPGHPTNVCVPLYLTGGSTKYYCFQVCQPRLGGNDCQAGLSCDPRSVGLLPFDRVSSYLEFVLPDWPLSGKPARAVCALPGCANDTACPVVTAAACAGCGADGKSCTPPVQKNCPAGQLCMSYAGGDEGRCTVPGVCDKTSGLCKEHASGKATAKVGDPCKDDTECAGNMRCLMEFDPPKDKKMGGESCNAASECCSGTCHAAFGKCTSCPVVYRNGYCTITDCIFAKTLTTKACPAGSACNVGKSSIRPEWLPPNASVRRLTSDIRGMCQKICDMTKAEDCRNNPNDLVGDYECRSWDDWWYPAVSMVFPAAHVCDFGPEVSCSLTAHLPQGGPGSSSCAVFGNSNNTTNMTCRTLDGKPTTDKYDPYGYCLDDTASGTAIRNPLP